MNRSALATALILTSVSLMTLGCCEKEKDRIALLDQENQVLLQAKGELSNLRSGLAKAQERCDLLNVEVQTKQTEIAGLKAKVSDLEGELAKKPTVTTPPVPPGWQETATGAKITLGSDILFSAGRASLTSKGAASLRSIAATIKGSYPTSQVRVYGFTDNDPIVRSVKLWKDNLDLSANRAMAVTRELRKLGVAADRIETIAMGKQKPIAANASKAGKARNRRVEIVVVRP